MREFYSWKRVGEAWNCAGNGLLKEWRQSRSWQHALIAHEENKSILFLKFQFLEGCAPNNCVKASCLELNLIHWCDVICRFGVDTSWFWRVVIGIKQISHSRATRQIKRSEGQRNCLLAGHLCRQNQSWLKRSAILHFQSKSTNFPLCKACDQSGGSTQPFSSNQQVSIF